MMLQRGSTRVHRVRYSEKERRGYLHSFFCIVVSQLMLQPDHAEANLDPFWPHICVKSDGRLRRCYLGRELLPSFDSVGPPGPVTRGQRLAATLGHGLGPVDLRHAVVRQLRREVRAGRALAGCRARKVDQGLVGPGPAAGLTTDVYVRAALPLILRLSLRIRPTHHQRQQQQQQQPKTTTPPQHHR